MATAIEYGLISALIAVAAVGATTSLTKKSPPAVAIRKQTSVKENMLAPYKDKNGVEYKDVLIDVQTKCQYFILNNGNVIPRQMEYEPSECLQ